MQSVKLTIAPMILASGTRWSQLPDTGLFLGVQNDEWTLLGNDRRLMASGSLSEVIDEVLKSRYDIAGLIIFDPYPFFQDTFFFDDGTWQEILRLPAKAIRLAGSPDAIRTGKLCWGAINPSLPFLGLIQPHLLFVNGDGDLPEKRGCLKDLIDFRREIERKVPGYWAKNSIQVRNVFRDSNMLYTGLEEFWSLVESIPIKDLSAGDAGNVPHIIGVPTRLDRLLEQYLGISVVWVEKEPLSILAMAFDELLSTHFPGGRHHLDSFVYHSAADYPGIVTRSIESYQEELAACGSFGQFVSDNGLQSATTGTLKYYKAGQQGDLILIINALGLSVRFWEPFVKLMMQKYRIVIWETRCCDIAEGGMREVVSIDEHVEDIASVIDAEGGGKYHLLSWCNGARIASAAAVKLGSSIGSVIYLCPAFRGLKDIRASDSKFEKDLDEVFASALKNRKMAELLSSYLRKTNNNKTDSDADQILGLPDFDWREAILAPMRKGEYLLNYAIRTEKDEAYPVRELIAAVQQRVLFILGSNDAVVSNEFVQNVLPLFKHPLVYMVTGASHYIQIQQPEVLAGIIDSFLRARQPLSISRRAYLRTSNQ